MDFPIPEVVYSWQFWISAVVCYVVCEAVKRIPKIADWSINIINLIVGALIYTAFINGWGEPSSYLFGILAASFADIAYQLFKNIVSYAVPTPQDTKTGGTD